jgi:hypothetical protein
VSEQDSEQKDETSKTSTPRPTPTKSSAEIFAFDDRLLILERSSVEYRRHLVNLEDVLINQMIALGVLEVVFAVFIAMTVWTQYRKVGP